MNDTIAAIVAAHRSGAASPEATIARSYARIRAHDDPAIFIALRDEADALAEAKALAAAGNTDLPLYGVPVAVKDNIDVKGLPTTAACPAFAYQPTKDATCVARLKRAGRDHDRQDQSRSVRHRPRRRAHALWRSAQPVQSGADPRRIEFGLGRRGRRRPRSARARHRHRRLRPGAGRLEQHRRAQAEPRARLHRRAGAGLPHARLRIGVHAHRR